MNTLIKRSMKIALAVVFIGASVVPACAQRGKGFKNLPKALGKKPPLTGTTPVVKPVTPRIPPTLQGAAVPTRTAIAENVLNNAVERAVVTSRKSAEPIITQQHKPISIKKVHGFVAFNEKNIYEQFPNLQNSFMRFIVLHDIQISKRKAHVWYNRFLDRISLAFYDLDRELTETIPNWDSAMEEFNNVLFNKYDENFFGKDTSKIYKFHDSLLEVTKPILEWRKQQHLYALGKISSLPSLVHVEPANSATLLEGKQEWNSIVSVEELEAFYDNHLPIVNSQYIPEGYVKHELRYYIDYINYIFYKTDAVLFNSKGDTLYVNREIVDKYPSYKELWNTVAKYAIPYDGAGIGWGTKEDSPLNKIFELRDQQVKKALQNAPVSTEHLSSRYMVVDPTTQRTAEEIKMLVENLERDNPLRQTVEGMLKTAEDDGYIMPITTPAE